jgi:hypothetical protein
VTYHVESTDRGWKVLKEGATRASASFETKPDAVARGRELAKGQARGRLVVHGKDGRVQDEFTYVGHPRRG